MVVKPTDSGEPAGQTEEVLRQSEERFRLLVEGVKDYAIFMLDADGHVTTWNQGAERIKGYGAEEILGRHFSVFYTEEDVKVGHPDEELRVAARDGRYEEEGVRVRKDGSTFHANVLITALRDPGGNLRGFAKVTRDITARKEAEERERQLAREQAARELTTDILESISDAFFAVDHGWRFTYVNRRAEELLNRAREGLLGRNIWEVFPREADSELHRRMRLAAEERVTADFETVSSVVGAWIAGRVYPSQEGLSVYFQDVTERRRAEEDRRRSEERYRGLFDSIDQGFCTVEVLFDGDKPTDYRFLEANPAFEKMTGLEEAIGKTARELVPDLEDWWFETYGRVALTGEDIRFENGSEAMGRWFEVRASRVGGAESRTVAILFTDVTGRKRADEALRASEERYRSFVGQSTEGIWRFELEEPLPVDLPEDEQIEHMYRHAYLAECNEATAAMYGFSRVEEIVGARLGEFMPREIPENVEYLRAFIRSGYRLTDAESEEVDRSGEPKRFLNNLTGVVEDGLVLRAWGIQRDVTAQRRAEETQRFLAEASDVLSSSLGYQATLSAVASLAVPVLADWCAVDVLDEDGTLRRLAVEHPDPAKVALAYKLQERYPTDPESPRGVHQVLRTGEPDMMEEVPPEMIEAAARDDEHAEILRGLGLRSYMVVPMVARGRTLGAISLAAAESGRRYGEDDLELAQELARRAALAVDNSRLYAEARREISEREWAQQELRASRDQMEVILRGVADGITAQDSAGRLVYANEAAARIVGYPSARAAMDRSFEERIQGFELLDESGSPFPAERLPSRRALRGEVVAEEVIRFRALSTGEERWVIVRAAPVFDEQGGVRLGVSIFNDVTERKRAEDALRRVRQAERNRMARDLHDGVLQDLAYTAASMGLIMLQTGDARLGEQLQEAIDAVRRAAQGLREAVNDLHLGDEEDRPLPALLENLVEKNRAMSRGQTVELEIGEGFPPAPLGQTGVEVLRVVQEALTNARRHSGADRIRVGLRREEDKFVVEVADDGGGFAPGAVPGVGSGTMRERATAIGGELEIESETGRGTRVRLRVPLPRRG